MLTSGCCQECVNELIIEHLFGLPDGCKCRESPSDAKGLKAAEAVQPSHSVGKPVPFDRSSE